MFIQFTKQTKKYSGMIYLEYNITEGIIPRVTQGLTCIQMDDGDHFIQENRYIKNIKRIKTEKN